MWYKDSVFYQIYPFGFCGAPDINDGIETNRIAKIKEWIPHLQKLGIGAVYLCPIFESDAHGYDTRDYQKIDCRLGSNEDFASVCEALHEAGIKVVLDGVFNHVGRGFFAFLDVLKCKEQSAYRDWFYIDFGGNSAYDDGFWYEGWEGHFNLVKLNSNNPAVREYLFSSIRSWVEQFEIDGLRLDVAYSLSEDFLRQLRSLCDSLKEDFFLVGETIHGDYNRIVRPDMLQSCTNYECFKGNYSSLNDRNMFEIAHSLNRQFGPEDWTIYKGLSLFNFVDNHDVARLASNLKEPRNLKNAYALMYGMPGIPCIYYGSEWGAQGEKEAGSDAALRPCFTEPIENDMTKWISKLSRIRREHKALGYGDYRQLYLTNLQFAFAREYDGNRIIVVINIADSQHTVTLPIQGEMIDLLEGETVSCSGSVEITAFSAKFYKV